MNTTTTASTAAETQEQPTAPTPTVKAYNRTELVINGLEVLQINAEHYSLACDAVAYTLSQGVDSDGRGLMATYAIASMQFKYINDELETAIHQLLEIRALLDK